jgi:annexin A7/11
LGKKLDAELGGNFEKLLFNCLQAAEEVYDPGFHNDDKMKEDTQKLYKMGQGSWGTDETGLFKILCASPPEYLKKLNLNYAEKHGFTLVKALETELGGDVKKASMYMLNMKVKPYETVANLIETACKGMGTNELLLTCCIIRYQSIMKEVMLAYIELFGKTIQDRVRGEVGGDYRALLLAVLEAADEN